MFMKIPLYRVIPGWMVKEVKKSNCAQCKGTIRDSDIQGIALINVDGGSTYAVEFVCSTCGRSARLTFEMFIKSSVEELCFMLIDEIHKTKTMNNSVFIENVDKDLGPISKREVNSFVKKMEKAETMEDFLKLIGATGYLDELKKSDKKDEN